MKYSRKFHKYYKSIVRAASSRSGRGRLVWIVLALVLAVLGGWWLHLNGRSVQPRPERAFLEHRAPLIFAHRGASAYAPENTIAAFRLALQQGADVLELDLRMTKDGRLVVFHDESLLRTTGVDARVRDLSFEELRQIDAAYRVRRMPDGSVEAPREEDTEAQADRENIEARGESPGGARNAKRLDEDEAEYPFRGAGHRIPALSEVFQAFPRARINIEIKDTEEPYLETALWREIERAGRADDVLVVSGSGAALERFRRISAGRVATGASLGEALGFVICAGLNVVCRPDYDALQLPYRGIAGMDPASPDLIRHARRHGLAVHYWTVNDAEVMRALFAAGADGLMTDRPDLAAQVRREFRESRPGPAAAAP